MKKLIFMLAMVMTAFTSCISDEEWEVHSGEKATARFKEIFYQDNKVRIHQMVDIPTEWAAAVEYGERPCEVFNYITGECLQPSESYHCRYRSEDGKVEIYISGQLLPDSNAEYAVMTVSMEACPEITKVHLVSTDYFSGENSTTESVPVIL